MYYISWIPHTCTHVFHVLTVYREEGGLHPLGCWDGALGPVWQEMAAESPSEKKDVVFIWE